MFKVFSRIEEGHGVVCLLGGGVNVGFSYIVQVVLHLQF